MIKSIHRPIDVIGVPLDLGAGCKGCRMGPDAVRCAELTARLRQAGYEVKDLGNAPADGVDMDTSAIDSEKAKHLLDIVRINRRLNRMVAASAANGRFPLAIGGDHSLAVGTIAGSARHRRIGVIWFDAHGDLNTIQTTPSGNVHGMSLAAALGYGHPSLTRLGGRQPKIRPEHVALIGTRSLDAGEEDLIRRLGIRYFSSRDVNRLGIEEVVRCALELASNGTEGVHLSLDMDGLDPSDAPGVGTPVSGGIRLQDAKQAMAVLGESGTVVSADIVEVNPALDLRSRTATAAVELICALFGQK
ncbi:arginase [Paenibacillus sp. H1-7]|uniref:arginase n=1 Tax=Paenibacillus sp. H1-7 TaxID=2282849 RepID=UPI001EF8B150|nr:arginase [Paenibacillus sp. H1-7]